MGETSLSHVQRKQTQNRNESPTRKPPLSQVQWKQNPNQSPERYPSSAWPFTNALGRKSKSAAQTCRRRYPCCHQGVLVIVPKLSHSARRKGLKIWSAYELEPDDSEGAKDSAALYRRTVFDQAEWAHHRSPLRHGRTILSMMGSKVVTALFPPVSCLALNAFGLAVYNQMTELHWLPSWFPLLHVSSLPFQLLAPALALLLVFRTNASFARFDEARRAWGSTVTKTRDIARKALTCIVDPSDAERLNKLLRHCVAFSFCMKEHMLREGKLKEDLTFLLEEDELTALLKAPEQPTFCLMTMSEIIHDCNISDTERALMSETITHFFDNLGACERISKTPIPLSYTRLTSRLLVIWHIALPLALWDPCNWGVIPATALSAAVLFCIEEVGVLIEEPSEIFPLESLCIFSSKNVENLVRTHGDYHRYLKVKGDHGQTRNNS
ncbi:unnamed protein product [Calypogeia fissa]